MACGSPSSCWAFGAYSNSAGAALHEALHGTGGVWTNASTPEPGGTSAGDANVLYGGYCVSASNCWAVRYFGTVPGGTFNEALHWNGNK